MSKTITRNEPCASHALMQPRMSKTCLKPSELFLSFIQVLFLLQLLLLYCSVEVGSHFLICRSKHSSVGDCPVTIWEVLLFRIRKLATSLCFRLRVFALPFSTCLVKPPLQSVKNVQQLHWMRDGTVEPGRTWIHSASRIEWILQMLAAARCPKPSPPVFRRVQTTCAKP